jgi:hypothetical protein
MVCFTYKIGISIEYRDLLKFLSQIEYLKEGKHWYWEIFETHL